jgi:polyvinyl alcohol dehydrogenase (cytochrome)
MLKRALAAAVLLAAVAIPAARADAPSPSCDWPMFGHDAARSFATPDGCSAVSPTTAPTLVPKWYFHAADAVSASPAIVDGHVFIGDWGGNFYSLSAATGAQEWVHTVDDTSSIGFGRIVSSAAYASVGPNGVVVFGGGATLYALDAKTGDVVGSECLDPRAASDTLTRCRTGGDEVEIESSPAVVEVGNRTLVVVGMDVHNGRDVGRAGVVALELTPSGLTPIWKFDPDAGVPYAGEHGLTTGSGSGSGCADVWGSPAVDTAARRVFFGTGSCDVAGDVGEHVWAVDLFDGHLVWKSDGPHTGDAATVDDDFGGALNLLPDNRVGAGSKDGTYYAFNRDTGAIEWRAHVGQYGHLTDGFAVGGILASAATGKVGDTDAVFIATAISTPNDQPLADGPDTAPPTVLDDPGRMFSLHAIDAHTGALLWRSPVARQAYGPPTYANGVVLVPSTFDFQIDAFDANTGLPLAARPMPGPPSSAPTAVGDTVYGGVGTSTGVGSPLAPLNGVYALSVLGG